MSELTVDLWVQPSPEEVFGAFSDPFRLRRWYGAPPGCHRTGATGDLGPGNPFQVNVIDAKGTAFTQTGRILEVVPGEGLVMELSWDGGPLAGPSTRATLTLRADREGTRLEVRQGPFSSRAALEAHRAYWEATLRRLGRVAAGEPVPCFEEFWEESRGYVDPLGIAAHTVLAGMREAGASPEALTQVEELLYTHLSRVPEEISGVLGAVLRARLGETSS